MPIWMIMMGLQLVFFIVSGVWILVWMRGKADVYDEKLMESTRKFMEEKRAEFEKNVTVNGSQPLREGQSK